MARLNLGMAQLKLGDFENGWENYEARWTGSAESAQGTFSKPECPLPFWNTDESTNGKSILVLTEQGFGDVFQFSRYLNHLSQRFLKAGFVCSIPTLRLMEWSFNQKSHYLLICHTTLVVGTCNALSCLCRAFVKRALIPFLITHLI